MSDFLKSILDYTLSNLAEIQEQPQNNEKYTKLCKDIIISEILNNESKVRVFAEMIYSMEKAKRDIFIKQFNDIILNNRLLDKVDINITLFQLNSLLLTNTDKNKYNINNKISFLLDEKHDSQIPFINIAPEENTKLFEFNMQLFLYELNRLPNIRKQRILQIFYNIMGDELPHKSNSAAERNNSSNYRNNTRFENENLRNIIKKTIDNYIPKCKDKLREIKELSQEFEYIIKSDYYRDCDDIENRLGNNIENRNELNNIIDEINNLYRNAYNRKHNKSSLSYVMDVEEDIDLLEHI